MALFELSSFHESKNPSGPEACFDMKIQRRRSTQWNGLLETRVRSGDATDINKLHAGSVALALGPQSQPPLRGAVSALLLLLHLLQRCPEQGCDYPSGTEAKNVLSKKLRALHTLGACRALCFLLPNFKRH